MKLIIRDDDLSHFANPNDLEGIYGGIWEKCPISFAVIPHVTTKGFETPLKVTKENNLFSIGKNRKLIVFLKKKIKEGKITIVQHGYSHRNYGKKFELERTDEEQIYKELKEGKEYLEKLFGIKINTLVAPHDRFSKSAINAAEKIGYKYICRAFAPLPREIQFNLSYLTSFYKLFLFWMKHRKKYRYPYILNFGKHQEIYAYRPNEIISKIDLILNFHKKYSNGVLCVTTHYRGMNIHTKELLVELINRSDSVTHLNKVQP